MSRLVFLTCLGLILHQGCCQTPNNFMQQYLTMQALSSGSGGGSMPGLMMSGTGAGASTANMMERIAENPALMSMFMRSQQQPSSATGTGAVPSNTGTSGGTGIGMPSTGRTFDPVVFAVMSGTGSSISNDHQYIFQRLASGTDMQGRPATLAQNLANALGNSGSGINKNQQQTILVQAFNAGHLDRLLDATTNLNDQMNLEKRGLPGMTGNQQMQMFMCPMNMRCGFQYCPEYETPYTPESFYTCQGCPRCRIETGNLNMLRSLRRRRNNPFARIAAVRHLSQNQGTNPLMAQALFASSLTGNYNSVPAPLAGIQYQPPPPVRNNQGQQQQGYQVPRQAPPPGSYPPRQGPPPAQQGYPPRQAPPQAQGYPPNRGPPQAQQGYPPRQSPPPARQGYPPQQGPPQARQAYPSQGPPPQGPPPGYAPAPRNFAPPSAQAQPGPPPRQQSQGGPPASGPKPTSEFITAIKNMGQTMARQQKAQNPKTAGRSRA